MHSKIVSSTPETLWLAVYLADRFICCEKNVDVAMVDLIAVSSLCHASNIYDRDSPPLRGFPYLTKGYRSRREIEEFSSQFLLEIPIDKTVIQEIEVYLQTLSTDHPQVWTSLQKYDISIDLIRSFASFHAERNLFDPYIAWQRPKLFAISALKTAFLSAFSSQNLNPTPSVRSPSNSVDSMLEGMILTSSSLDGYDDYFTPLRDPITRPASISDASATSGNADSDAKKTCAEEILQILSEISGESFEMMEETSLLIAKNVNSDFYFTLHPSSPVFEPNTFMSPSPSTQGRATKKKSGSPGPSPRHIVVAARSFSDTHIPSAESQEIPTPTPCTPSTPDPTGTSSRSKSVSNGVIYGLKACQSALREKYSQPRYFRVANIVVPIFEQKFLVPL